MRILFFIGTLGTGGAECQLAQLAAGLSQRGHDVSLATIYPGGQNWDWLQQHSSVRVHSLFARKASNVVGVGWQLGRAVWRLRELLHREHFPLVYSALYMSNLIAWLAVRRPGVGLVWGIRASNLDLNWKRAIPFHLCKWTSPSVSLLIANSQTGLAYHQRQGYQGQKHVVIPNGIDTDRFRPDPEAGARVRAEWGVSEQEKLVGLVGRLDLMKDHPTFLRAATQLAQEQKDVRFVCVGDGPADYRQQLQTLSQELDLTGRLIWAGIRTDMPAVYNALDIACSSSYGEGFPNVIGEAMACGAPCVVTDVGDSAWIVGNTGIVVPPRDPEALARGFQQLLDDLRERPEEMAACVRQRIEAEFSLNALVNSTTQALADLAQELKR